VLFRSSTPHKLERGDRVFFGVRNSTSFVEKRISGGLTRYAPFYVNSVINETEFLVSESLYSQPLSYSGQDVILEEEEFFCVIYNITEEILKTNIISLNGLNVSVGNLLEISAGGGQLVSPTRVSSVRSANSIVKAVSSISIGSPAIISENNHGLFSLDIVKFSTSGTLPFGIDSDIPYLVEKINENQFSLFDPASLLPIETKEGTIPDTENETYRTQSGTHSFIKDINDKDRIVLSRSVNKDLSQYKIVTEQIQTNQDSSILESVDFFTDISYENEISIIQELQTQKNGKAGFSSLNKELALSASRNGIIKNHLTKSSFSETDINKFASTRAGTMQSSALVFSGPSFEFETGENAKEPIDFVSYIHKPLENKFTHFGARLRILGRINQEESSQTIYNSLAYFQNPSTSPDAAPDKNISVSGGSAGIGVMINPETNIGYYFEILALSESNAAEYSEESGIFNLVFYKVVRKVANEEESPVSDNSKAIPIKLWQGTTNIIADDGTMVGQFRMFNESNPSV
jgi:hypothetical protein